MPAKVNTQASPQPQRKPPSQLDSVFVSDDDDDDIVVKSTWRTRHLKPAPKTKVTNAVLGDETESSAVGMASSSVSLSGQQTVILLPTPRRTFSATTTMDDSPSSEEEFTSLLERLKKKNKLSSSTFSPKNAQGTFIWSIKI